MSKVLPYKNSDDPKKTQVAGMFDKISPTYDFLNHILSFQTDKRWRKKAIRILKDYKHETILDIATGTGDFAIAAAKLKPAKIIGIDISEGMLAVGRRKIEKLGLANLITMEKADSESLPFGNNSFDIATIGFGVRNFESPVKGMSEICRVLKPGGILLVLEFSKTENSFFKILYGFYFRCVLPVIGRLISHDKDAYKYLHDSVEAFPSGAKFIELMVEAGFHKTQATPLTFGIASIYIGEKMASN
jgi:demethylmenaquinone methyltransferase/2-methoxy-6-polyprenyl-1,4-benzoquinol methylase